MLFKKRKLNEEELVDFILSKLEDTNITKETIELILDCETEYLIKVGIAK